MSQKHGFPPSQSAQGGGGLLLAYPDHGIRMNWVTSHRVVGKLFPPVELFEDVTDVQAWDYLAEALRKTGTLLLPAEEITRIKAIPVGKRVGGKTASIALAPFLYYSVKRPGRFSDGSFGVWYCGETFDVALAETVFHFANFMRATGEPAQDRDFIELRCPAGGFVVSASMAELAPDDYSPGQALGALARSAGYDGILYPSVRHLGGQAAALFWPSCLTLPVQSARKLQYRWDGQRVSHYRADEGPWQEVPHGQPEDTEGVPLPGASVQPLATQPRLQ